jgi:CheY-like chemotaxis protein
VSAGPRRRRLRPLEAVDSRLSDIIPVVLVVDDDPAVREMLRLSLTLEGWAVEEARSGEDAVEEWHRVAPDVVLLDHRLSGMSGLECTAQLRALSEETRIILISAHLNPDATQEARRLRVLPMPKTDRARLFELLAVLADQVRGTASAVG